MLELLATYSLKEIAVFLVLFLLAVKEGITIWDFFKDRKKLMVEHEEDRKANKESVDALISQMKTVDNTLNVLIESDKDDIKSWLVDKLNYYKDHPEKQIDAYSMDTIEKRFKHYKDEGGNSYIENDVMVQLRKLAKEDKE